MTQTKEQQKGQEFLTSIYKKSWEDPIFKEDLINKPIETLNTFTGRIANFPVDKKMVVEDQTNPNHIYLNIPAKPYLDDVELNEEQLERVAGGCNGQEDHWWDVLIVRNWFD